LRPIDLYVGLVNLGGAVVLVVLLTDPRASIPLSAPAFWVLSGCLLAGELFPISLGSEPNSPEVTTSTAFTYALMLAFGTPAAVVVQAACTLVTEVLHRKPPWRMVFNVSQFILAVAASGASLSLITGRELMAGSYTIANENLGPILAGGLVLLATNSLMTGIAITLAQGRAILPRLPKLLFLQPLTDVILCALAPIIVVVTERSLFLVPLLMAPLAAVYKSTRFSMESAQLARELAAQAQRNEYQAMHDALTDLPNRSLFRDRVGQAILSAQRDQYEVAVILFDIDRFKEVNDALGHQNGDRLLRMVGPRLEECLRESDTIARLGGDEFAILLPKVAGPAAAVGVAEKIATALAQPFEIQGLNLELDASIGIAFYPDHGADADTLLQRADVAMYMAKDARTGIEIYDARHDHYSPSRLALVGELRRAIDRDELVLLYQPKADLRNRNIPSVEALLRWQHPTRGTILPEEFIPLAEHTGLMRPLMSYVVDQALAQVARWHADGLELGVAVNLSVQNLLDVDLPAEINALLDRWGLPPAYLILEITESGIMGDPVRTGHVLTQLHRLGVGLSIDDFGTGYSSLTQLGRMPVTEIKIDRSFVMSMTHEESSAVIVRSTIDLGRNLGLRVVAEGVESEQIWHELEMLGCDQAQGYLISHPLTADDIPVRFNGGSPYVLAKRNGQARPLPQG
jgi:diguanylate cyclase (GGDEF)-like protein